MKKFLTLLLSAAMVVLGTFIIVKAFTGPGSNQPPNGSPAFWQLNGTNMYYNGGNVGIGTSTPANLFTIATTTNIFSVLSNGNVGIGTASPGYKLDVNGTFAATIKNFDIPHPLDPQNKRLIHSVLEGPEVAVFYRGESQLVNGKVEVFLPVYFEALARKEGRTVLLTPLFESIDEPISNLAASVVVGGKFLARAVDLNNFNQKFYWEVKAVRADVSILEVEKLVKE